jgi:hypothetical protein
VNESEEPTRDIPGDPEEDATEALERGDSDPETETAMSGSGEPETVWIDDPETSPTQLYRDAEASSAETRGRWIPPKGSGLLALSIWASVALSVAYILAGGLDFKPAEAADPCEPRAWVETETLEDTAEQFALSALDGAACELGVSRAELTRALASPEALEEFTDRNGFSDDEVEGAIRAGANRAISEGEAAGEIDPLVALGLRTAVDSLPLTELIDLIQNASALFGGGGDLGGTIGGVLGILEEGRGPDGELDLGRIIEGVLGDQGSGGLRDQLPEGLQGLIPDDPEQIQEGLEGLFAPR